MDAAVGSSATGYDLATAQFLSNLVGLAYAQFDNPSWNGQIPADQVPPGYAQIAAFRVPELDLRKAVDTFLDAHPEFQSLIANDVSAMSDDAAASLNRQLSDALEEPEMLARIMATSRSPRAAAATPAWFGFALAPVAGNPAGSNVIAIRGTRTAVEWALDATAVQVPVPLLWFSDGKLKFARVHLGFLILFAFLKPQIDTAVKKFNTQAAGTLVAGHSLGGALSTLTSVYVKLTNLLSPLQMYNQASPRVGDSTFVRAYNYFIPSAFRIVNLADVVPVLPPTSVSIVVHGIPVSVQYGDVGQAYSYLWQTGDIGNNHGWQANYNVATQANVPTNAPRTYPNTGNPC